MHETTRQHQPTEAAGRPDAREYPRAPEAPRIPPRFFAGSRLDYEHGVEHGVWIDATQDDAAIASDITAMLARSPTAVRNGIRAHGWAVLAADHFAGLRLRGERSLEWIGAVGRGIAHHGPAFAVYADVVEEPAALAEFENDYLGAWPSFAAYVQSFEDDAGYNRLLDDNLPDSIRGYVRLDVDAIARDMRRSGAVHAVPLPDGQIAVFAGSPVRNGAPRK